MRQQPFALTMAMFGLLLCVWPIRSPYSWPISALAVAALFYLTGARLRDYSPLSIGSAPRHVRLAWLWILAFGIYEVRLYRDSYEVLAEVNPIDTLDLLRANIAVKDVSLLMGVMNLMVFNRRQSLRDRMMSLAGGMAVYGLATLAFDVVFPEKMRGDFGQSRFEGKEGRWLPALCRSNEHFSWMQALSLSTIVTLGLYHVVTGGGRARSMASVMSLLILAPISLLCVFRTEFRGHLSALLGTLGFLACWMARRPRLGLACLTIFVVAFPLSFFSDLGPKFMDMIQIDAVVESLGSKGSRSSTLTGRTDYWYYAGQRLALSMDILLVGDGPALRDASPAELYESIPGYRMNFHSGIMELLMAHGLVAALCIVGLILYAIAQLRLGVAATARSDDGTFMALSWVAASIALSVTGPSLGVFEMGLLAVMPLLAALGESDGRVGAAGSVSKDRQPMFPISATPEPASS